ncbi:MAG: ribonuclease H-like domain-containing protein [Armatimonadetes bacterium]|nr:ribonuclease H-like domain-containing protein [Armatimonadota bacterium]
MLNRTFCHVKGIGKDTERALWAQGCDNWNTFLANPSEFSTGAAPKDFAVSTIQKSVDAFEAGNHQFFQKALGTQEAWRAWSSFQNSCVYLDIETDGGQTGGAVTIIGLYDGNQFQVLVKDDNIEEFRDVISKYSMIVTFFGTGFDLPMLQKRFRGLVFDQIHLDLCFALKRLDYRGGLKKIERQLGISRSSEADGLDGRDAIRLWREHLRGSETALETLVAYNREDVVNLEVLAQIAVDGLTKQAMFGTESAARP